MNETVTKTDTAYDYAQRLAELAFEAWTELEDQERSVTTSMQRVMLRVVADEMGEK